MTAVSVCALFAVIAMGAMATAAFCARLCLRSWEDAWPPKRRQTKKKAGTTSEQEQRETARKAAEIANFFRYDGTEMPKPEEVTGRNDR